jgi:hypothetical protein
MNLFGMNNWNAAQSQPLSTGAPPRDWPSGDPQHDDDDDDDDDDIDSAPPSKRPRLEPALPVVVTGCDDFVFDPVPPAPPSSSLLLLSSSSSPANTAVSGDTHDGAAAGYHHRHDHPTLSGFHDEQHQQRALDPEEGLAKRIMANVQAGYESPYFAGDARNHQVSAPCLPDGQKKSAAQHNPHVDDDGDDDGDEEDENDEEEDRYENLRALRAAEESESRARARSGPELGEFGREGAGFSTDCCTAPDGGDLWDSSMSSFVSRDLSLAWCFGCQWGAHGHRPVDNTKIQDLVDLFKNLIHGGSTTIENIARIVSDTYRRTIQIPARRHGQELPDWPPAVVKRHIENMTEPQIVNKLLIRKNLALLNNVFNDAVQYDAESGRTKTSIPACTMWCRLLRENRELYRQVPKEAFGYNPSFRAESWSGSALVHPTRVQYNSENASAGAASAASGASGASGNADIRRYVHGGSGVVDTGEPRGPGNDEELVLRRQYHVGNTMSAESGV